MPICVQQKPVMQVRLTSVDYITWNSFVLFSPMDEEI